MDRNKLFKISNKTYSIRLPEGIMEDARSLRLNISGIIEQALLEAIKLAQARPKGGKQ